MLKKILAILRFNFNDWWANELGFSAAHMIRPDVSLSNIETLLNRKFTFNYSTSLQVSDEKLFVSPKFLGEIQGDFASYLAGVTIYLTDREHIDRRWHYTKPLYVGIFYRNRTFTDTYNTKSIILNAGHSGLLGENHYKYQIGFSYDLNLGGLSMSTNGAFELSLTLTIPKVLKTGSGKRWSRCRVWEGNPLSPIN